MYSYVFYLHKDVIKKLKKKSYLFSLSPNQKLQQIKFAGMLTIIGLTKKLMQYF